MYLDRALTPKLEALFEKFPILAVLGPRQSGKTTLVQQTFPNLAYYNLENPNHCSFAAEDPYTFLSRHPEGMIIDEVQKLPNLFSYLQIIADEQNQPGQFILTGSHNILLNDNISQSLAGRVALTTLLPLSLTEINPRLSANEIMFRGFYPRLYNNDIDPLDFYPNYINTYIEKDVRQIKNVVNLSQFQKFMGLCAGRIGQILNVASLSTDCSISQATTIQWLSLLEMSYIIFRLQPHHRNFNKRLIKSPKLYFYDTGIAANLLRLQSPDSLDMHFAKGALFENMVISELIKQVYNEGRQPHFYYWRDKSGHEIDLLIDQEDKLIPIEIKSGQTINSDYFKNLIYWQKLAHQDKSYVIYGGNEEQKRSASHVLSWRMVNYKELLVP
jgi:hypothetical protein